MCTSRLHFESLTRREELDEDGLSGDSVVPSFRSQLHGVGHSQKAEEGCDSGLHGSSRLDVNSQSIYYEERKCPKETTKQAKQHKAKQSILFSPVHL